MTSLFLEALKNSNNNNNNSSNNNNNNNNNNSKDKNNNKYNDRIKMMTNDLLDEIYYVSIEETMKTYM